MSVITISRQFGAGGRFLAELVAKRLGYRFVHEDMIEEVAERMQASQEQIRSIEKRGADKLMSMLERFINVSYLDSWTSSKSAQVDEKKYLGAVKDVLLELYERGSVVIVGRGSQFTLQGLKNAHHVLLVADKESRIKFMCKNYSMTERDAARAIDMGDSRRTRYLSFFAEPLKHNDPLIYDMTINTGRVPTELAVDLISDLVRRDVE